MNQWKEILTRNELIEVLEDFFYRDIESWFNSSTYYCDNCIDEFKKQWPGIYSWTDDFQRISIGLNDFYNGSRLKDSFEKEEFNNLFEELKCPNCGSKKFDNIWPYEMEFDVPINFESHLEEIALLAEKTPFLMLNHPFAKLVYDEIHELSKTINSSELKKNLYRARKYDDSKPYNNDDFLAPDKKFILEGRYNHAGEQVLYLAENKSTCFYEMREPKDGIMLSKIEISKKIKILDLLDDQFEENSIIQAIKLSSLLSSPAEGEGHHKPHYVFTRFISDVVISAGFDAIRYPSVRIGNGKNIVVLNYEKINNRIKILHFDYYNEEDKIRLIPAR